MFILIILLILIIFLIEICFKFFKSSDISDKITLECVSDNIYSTNEFIKYNFEKISSKAMIKSSQEFFEILKKRRSVRKFSQMSIPDEVLINAIKTAGTAPSGANTQPWRFVVVKNNNIKHQIRQIVEYEEEINYQSRMSQSWINDLKPLKTNHIKKYITDAPVLILIFKQLYHFGENGQKKYNYYNEFSVSIATGILICSLQISGLCTLITTPMNCGPRLRELLNRSSNEKLQYLIPVGYPSTNCHVPKLNRKELDEIMTIF